MVDKFRHPIIKIAIEIIPNRLNSDCLSKILSQYLDKFEIMFFFVKLNLLMLCDIQHEPVLVYLEHFAYLLI